MIIFICKFCLNFNYEIKTKYPSCLLCISFNFIFLWKEKHKSFSEFQILYQKLDFQVKFSMYIAIHLTLTILELVLGEVMIYRQKVNFDDIFWNRENKVVFQLKLIMRNM